MLGSRMMGALRFTLVVIVMACPFGAVSCSKDPRTVIAPVKDVDPASDSAPGVGAPAKDGALGPALAPGANLVRAFGVQERLSRALLANSGVVGTAIGADAFHRPVVMVLIRRAGLVELPASVEGVGVVAEISGELRPFGLTQRYRPVPIGVSAGNANECLPGTIGCVIQDGKRKFLLSANHVFARQNQAAIGEDIVQPSSPDADPGCGPSPPANVVGSLADFEPVIYDGKTPNVMDAAIALVAVGATCATLPTFYGAPSSALAVPEVGLPIEKVGRTTELTFGAIKAINAKVKITFPSGTALFVDQVITTNGFGAFGDSGSLIVTDDATHRPVAMIIGGSNNGTAIATPIGPILQRFAGTVCGN